MAVNVNVAFRDFLNNTVNIDGVQNDIAGKSKNWLYKQVHTLGSNGSFLKLASSYDIGFGSYARKTQIRPLDDIDIIIGLNGSGTTCDNGNWDDISLEVKNESKNSLLISLCDKSNLYWNNDKYYLNSNKVKNKLVSALRSVSQYEKSEIHARGEAVTLKLRSYEWTFDIVPAFYVGGTDYSNPYYLIPNGKGKWKKTNPKLEQSRVSKTNQKFNNVVLNVIRLVKYWNRRGKMPNITSYVLETMVLDYFDQTSHNKIENGNTSDWVDLHFRNVLNYIDRSIWSSVQDTKNIQGNINSLTWEQKNKIQQRSRSDYYKAVSAVNAEVNEQNHKKSINIWRDIFGLEFPTYG